MIFEKFYNMTEIFDKPWIEKYRPELLDDVVGKIFSLIKINRQQRSHPSTKKHSANRKRPKHDLECKYNIKNYTIIVLNIGSSRYGENNKHNGIS